MESNCELDDELKCFFEMILNYLNTGNLSLPQLLIRI
jgi:hypothetical protein